MAYTDEMSLLEYGYLATHTTQAEAKNFEAFQKIADKFHSKLFELYEKATNNNGRIIRIIMQWNYIIIECASDKTIVSAICKIENPTGQRKSKSDYALNICNVSATLKSDAKRSCINQEKNMVKEALNRIFAEN